MAYVQPTLEDFRLRFPELENVDDEVVDAALSDSFVQIGAGYGKDQALAQMLWAADQMQWSLDILAGGEIQSESVGPFSQSYKSASNTDGFAFTTYGRRLRLITRRHFGGPIVLYGT